MRTRYMRAHPARLGQVEAISALPAVASSVANVVSGIMSSLSAVGIGEPANDMNASRTAYLQTLLTTAMTNPGSASSVAAVVTLANWALGTPIIQALGHYDEPVPTRAIVAQALQSLAQQGWQNVDSANPVFIGANTPGTAVIPEVNGAVATSAAPSQSVPGSPTYTAAAPSVVVGGAPSVAGAAAGGLLGLSPEAWLLLLGGAGVVYLLVRKR